MTIPEFLGMFGAAASQGVQQRPQSSTNVGVSGTGQGVGDTDQLVQCANVAELK